MLHHGFLRVAAAAPQLRVADCEFNADRTLAVMQRAEADAVDVLAFPELGLTAYTCGDLFHHPPLLAGAIAALQRIVKATTSQFSGLLVVGLPLRHDDQLFNCAAVIQRGKLLGIVPKSHLPNYKEFYEDRWFSPAGNARSKTISIDNTPVPFGADMLFDASDSPGLTVGVEICEDIWVPIPPSCFQALAGASVLLNLSASNELIGKAAYRRQLVASQSGRCVAAYVYAACGVGESTTDVVFGGHCIIGENSSILAEAKRFARDDVLLVADVDLDRLATDRLRTGTFSDALGDSRLKREYRRIEFTVGSKRGGFGFTTLSSASARRLLRTVDAHPFVPTGQDQLRERCEEIFSTQVAGLAKRLDHIAGRGAALPLSIGISGGLDSTLALLVVCRTLDALGWPRNRVKALTMPGFGTTTRTLQNARDLMRCLGVSGGEADIRQLCLDEWRALKHAPFNIPLDGLNVDTLTAKLRDLPPERRNDLVFENVQARMRTSLLMNAGFVIGTGDLSELALGWCTYNADHMSMYNPNISIPKTLVKFLVRWAAENEFEGDARRVLLDIVATVISPELLPADAQGAAQSTESSIGPYELHDFFLYQFLRYATPPEKILYLAEHAKFDQTYSADDVKKWLRVFITRFFANQFKRSCLPDGPKVGTVSLSPRGDWRMPSDAQARLWLDGWSQ
ncbi:MAG: NAD(+) synthase [Gemmataceae bacterium]